MNNSIDELNKQLIFIDKVCARMLSEYHQFAFQILQAQAYGMKFEFCNQIHEIEIASFSDLKQKEKLTDEEEYDMKCLLKRVFKQSTKANRATILEHNLFQANAQYQHYAKLRNIIKDQIINIVLVEQAESSSWSKVDMKNI